MSARSRAFARTPVLCLLLGIMVVVAGGCDAPTRPERSSPVASIALDATLTADGTVQVRQDVAFLHAKGGSFVVAAPLLGSLSDVAVDGNQRSGGGDSTTLDVRARQAAIDATVTGGTDRYTDVAEVSVVVWAQQPSGALSDIPVPVRGVLHLPVAPVTVHWHGAANGHATIEGSAVRLDGTVATNRASTLVVTVPAAAVPGVAVVEHETGASYLESRQTSLDDRDGRVARDLRNEQQRQDRLAQGYWGLVGVELGIPLLVMAVRLGRAGRRRRSAGAGVPHSSSDPPGDEPPALVALLRHEGHDIGAAAAAATILDLVQRKVIGMSGITSEHWVIDVNGSGGRPSSPGEKAIVTALRSAADEHGNVTGPPLPMDPDGPWWHTLRADVVAQARAQGLLVRRFPSGLFVTAVIALTVTTAPLWFRTPLAAAAGMAAAIVFLALPFAGGFVLTAEGLRRRAAWMSFARYIHEQGNLGDVPPTGIAIWGPYLSQGAALGEAPKAVAGLTPARGHSASRPGPGTITAALLLGAILLSVAGAVRPQHAAAEAGPVGPLPTCAVGSRSDFRASHPTLDLIQAQLPGVDLSCQDLSGIDFGQATLTGTHLAKAKLDGADLIQAQMAGVDLRGASAVGTKLGQATMTDGHLKDADLTKADLGQAQLSGAALDRAILKGASLTQVTVEGASLAGVDLSGSKMTGLELSGVNLRGAKLHGSDLTFGKFTRCDLRDADLSDTVMFSADFTKADGRGATFDGAKLTDVHFDGADLTGATFRGADVGGSSAADAVFRGSTSPARTAPARWPPPTSPMPSACPPPPARSPGCSASAGCSWWQ